MTSMYFLLTAFGLWAIWMVLYGGSKYTGERTGILGTPPEWLEKVWFIVEIILIVIAVFPIILVFLQGTK